MPFLAMLLWEARLPEMTHVTLQPQALQQKVSCSIHCVNVACVTSSRVLKRDRMLCRRSCDWLASSHYASGEPIQQITDVTEQFRRVHALVQLGNIEQATHLMPLEREYPARPHLCFFFFVAQGRCDPKFMIYEELFCCIPAISLFLYPAPPRG